MMEITVLVAAFSLLANVHSLEGGCQFCYSKQPPESAAECNPYQPSSVQLECQVKGPLGADLSIKWFHRSELTNTITKLQSDNDHYVVVSSTATKMRTITSRKTITDLTVGDYWCQVFHDNFGLLSSQKLGIASEDDYAREDPCEENMSLSEPAEKCADILLPDHLTQGESSTCPLNEFAVESTSGTAAGGYTTRTLIPPTTTNTVTGLSSTNTYNQLTTETSASTMPQSSSRTTPSIASWETTKRRHHSTTTGSSPIRQSSDPVSADDNPQKAGTWLYVVIGLSGVFLLLIVILAAVFVLLCLSRPRNKRATGSRCRLDTLSSPVTTDPPSRPLTSMTMQTDEMLLSAPPTIIKESRTYDPFDQDYEDIDEGKEDDDLGNVPLTMNPRYHEQGPSAAQPIYTIPTQSPNDVQYSEIGSPTGGERNNLSVPHMTPGGFETTAPPQMHGYGKLDHSARPRQMYNPKRDSPLLSGYRKLDHMRGMSLSSRSTTLPHGMVVVSPGYANIAVSNGDGEGHHFRSISLPSSEYSNLNPAPNSQPTTPTSSTPAAITPTGSKKYSNFEIIEACHEESEPHPPASRRGSEDYHMLADATIDRTDPVPNISREEYEFLPVCMCDEEEDSSLMNSPDSVRLRYGPEMEQAMKRKGGQNSIGRDLVEEKMSIASHSSGDFTGPFFFAHMPNFGMGSVNQEQDRHVYRALDVSTMEPQKGYASVSVKND